jgi:hypothetical protein
MRRPVDEKRVRDFFRALASATPDDARIYVTGGATALLYGWRKTTIAVDLKIVPERDSILRAIPRLKEELEMNIELAAPDQFIPELPRWQARSPLIERDARISYHHYDLYAQALAKIERGHEQDLADVREMLNRSLINPADLWRLFCEIEPKLYRYPAIDARSFRRAVERILQCTPE